MALEVTIHERGNGFPGVGSYVPGSDGNLYRVSEIYGRIHTGQPGEDNYVNAVVEEADWGDVDSDDDVFPACASVPREDEDLSEYADYGDPSHQSDREDFHSDG
jgi:hypothetical protein